MFVIFRKREDYKFFIKSDGNSCSVDIKICAFVVWLITLRYKSTFLYNKQHDVHDFDDRMENICIDEWGDKSHNAHSS